MSEIAFKLRTPIKVGAELVTDLTLKSTARAWKDFSLPMSAEGKIDFQPYVLAQVGLKMAAQAPGLVDHMDAADMFRLSQVVMSFFGLSQSDGSTP